VAVVLAAGGALVAGAWLLAWPPISASRAPRVTPAAGAVTAPRPAFAVIAHRGNSIAAPENTLAAIREALDLGVPIVEVDVYLSRDGVPVVFHDESVDRTTDGSGLVWEKTLAELKVLDAGSWKSARYAGERIPTLAEALGTARGRGRLLLDLKMDGMGRAIAGVLDRLGLGPDSVLVGTWSEAQAADAAAHLPGAVILAAGDAPAAWDAGYFERERARGIRGLELEGGWSRELIAAAQAHGLTVYAYTINDQATMRRLIEMGVDGIETDDPAMLLGVLEELVRAGR
jgi:glycerophosphoryl diester phosphodiesterase